jgi:hypothetical protein
MMKEEGRVVKEESKRGKELGARRGEEEFHTENTECTEWGKEGTLAIEEKAKPTRNFGPSSVRASVGHAKREKQVHRFARDDKYGRR